MSIQIEEIIDELHNKYNIPKVDIARIVKSQFKVLKNTIKAKGDKIVNLRYIGKYKPTPFRMKQLNQIKEDGASIGKVEGA